MRKTGIHFLFIAVFAAVPLVMADVVEMKTGERFEGTFRSATSAGVVIEVGGQSISNPLEQVRAIYFGSSPTPQTATPQPTRARDALQALKALQSVTTAGVNYRDYAMKVLDAKVKVDQFLALPQQKEGPQRIPIALAMRYHELAVQAWRAKVFFNNNTSLGSTRAARVEHTLEEDPGVNNCAGLKEWIASAKARFDQPNKAPGGLSSPPIWPESRFSAMGLDIGAQPAILWRCASERISEAERLLGHEQ